MLTCYDVSCSLSVVTSKRFCFILAYNVQPKFGTRLMSLPTPSSSAECRNLTFGPSLLCNAGSLVCSRRCAMCLACCDRPHRSFCQFRRTTWTLLLVVSLLLLRDFGTLFHWTVELLHAWTHLRTVLRHFSLIRHNCTEVARASVLWRDINLLIDWLCGGDMISWNNNQFNFKTCENWKYRSFVCYTVL